MKRKTSRGLGHVLPLVICGLMVAVVTFVACRALKVSGGAFQGEHAQPVTKHGRVLLSVRDMLQGLERRSKVSEVVEPERGIEIVRLFTRAQRPVRRNAPRAGVQRQSAPAYAGHLRFVGYLRESDGTDLYLFTNEWNDLVVKLGMRAGRGVTLNGYATTGIDKETKRIFFTHDNTRYEVTYE